MKPILQMKGITKSFNNVVVLDNVDLEVSSGQVHALLGENGAGKSTLMKILSGVYKKDCGEIYINGEKVENESPLEANERGISIVHQELSLVSSLSVMENVYLGREYMKNSLFIDFDELRGKTEKILKLLDAHFLPNTKVADLSIADKQLVEIAKALSIKSKILVLDEPTSSLSGKEIEKLFDIIRKLQSQNVSIIYISHHLDEIFEIADRITILRDGRKVHSGKIDEIDEKGIVRHMAGRPIQNLNIKRHNANFGKTIIEVKNLAKRNKIHNVNFEIREGEIVGFAGLVGAGRSDIAKIIFGLESYDKGDIYYLGKKVYFKSSTEAANNKIAYVPEDRRRGGVLHKTEIVKNITLKYLDKKFFINFSEEEEIANKMIKLLNVKCENIYQKAGELSGGNQQKAVLSKWLFLEPKLLILDEPTRGIDVNAKFEIYEVIRDLADKGVAIMLISSELPELLSLSDKIEVVREGTIVKEFLREEATQEKIMYYAVGGTK